MTTLQEHAVNGRGRLQKIFRYLRDFSALRYPVCRRLEDHPWVLRFKELPSHPSIKLRGGRSVTLIIKGTSDPSEEDGVLLRVRRPVLKQAPPPPSALEGWIENNWQDPQEDVVRVVPNKLLKQADGTERRVAFEDSPERMRLLDEWKARRQRWAELERPARKAQSVFEHLYELHGRISREGEN